MPNVELDSPTPSSAFRKIAIGTWSTSYDPQVYGTLTVRMEEALRFIDEFRAKTGKRLTVTHLVAKAVALAFKRMPDANAILRFSRIYPRKVISVFLQVAMEDPVTGKPDLSGTTLPGVDQMTLEQIVDATEKSVARVRKDEDKALSQSRRVFSSVPGWLLHRVLKLFSFLLYTLNLDLSWAGVPKDGFGSVMITNIGSLGLETAFVPLVPWSRVPMLITVGRVSDEAVVENGHVIPGKVMRLCATFDHRFIDGAHAAVLARVVEEVFREPERLLA
jgi:pyruvate/2-oxoglutarate dehydrogenase complex dihydrolipoamide acyltransferase (E2) component